MPKPYTFIYLEKLSGKVGFPYYIQEIILIENPPQNKHLLDSIMYDYRINKGLDLCTIDSCISEYCIAFYEKTERTSYFIEHREDSEHSIDETYPGSNSAKETLEFFFYHRLKGNPKIWYSTFPEEFKDTIYCE
jgi:hypothetical protein